MSRLSRAVLVAPFILVVAGSAVAQQPAPQAPLRLAWINSQEILAATPGRSAAESLFAREMAGARTEVQRLSSELDSAMAQYQRAEAAMTPALRTQRQEQIRQMGERNRARATDLDQQMQAREAELTRPIMERVNAVIEGVRAEFNYAFVFDVAAQNGPIVTADRALNITALIIQRLQAAGDPGPPGAAAPATPGDTTRPVAPPTPPVGPRVRPRP